MTGNSLRYSLVVLWMVTAVQALSITQQLLQAETVIDRFRVLPNNSDFIFDFNNITSKTGSLIAANRKTFPPLVGTSLGLAVGRLGPCGINMLHSHPRSAELQIVVEGRLRTTMSLEDGVIDLNGKRRIIETELKQFQMTPFYQGSAHTQFNPDCGNVTFISVFATEDFGTEQTSMNLFSIPNDLLSATLGDSIEGVNLDFVRNRLPAGITQGVEQCLKQCKIDK